MFSEPVFLRRNCCLMGAKCVPRLLPPTSSRTFEPVRPLSDSATWPVETDVLAATWAVNVAPAPAPIRPRPATAMPAPIISWGGMRMTRTPEVVERDERWKKLRGPPVEVPAAGWESTGEREGQGRRDRATLRGVGQAGRRVVRPT